MLAPGTRVGAYEILGRLGVGGMGEVYRARDGQLKRDVAIKVLPDTVARDAERVARFQREAEVLAALNHPNIAQIYGIEKGSGHAPITAIVMELVEGETLAERIAQGAIAIDEALPIAKQIAAALEAAHELGIIHRDLKPANIKVRPDGMVKVLDFGLAKAMESSGGLQVGDSQSPTITTPAMTQAGMILGTAAYMSPEQAKGRAIDQRTDVWAFGAVLFEMLTGARAFPGEDVTDTLAAVVKLDPKWESLGDDVPSKVRQVLKVCLQKDPRQRAQAIGDVRLALDGAFETVTPLMAVSTSSRSRAALPWWLAGAATLAATALAGVLFFGTREPVAGRTRLHLSVPLPGGNPPLAFALSPDGRSVVITGGGDVGLLVRSLDSGEQRTLTGTRYARWPFWSPDSRTIAFFDQTEGALKTVGAAGGPPQTLCEDTGFGGGGTWHRNGTVVVASEAGVLKRVAATGGPCAELTGQQPGVVHRAPVFLPDGDHFLYLLNASDETRSGLYVASLSEPRGRRLLADRSSALFVPSAPGSNRGRLLFNREQKLMAQAFDAASIQLLGDPIEVASQVESLGMPIQLPASADENGTLMYLINALPERQLVWYDRSGKELGRAARTGLRGDSVSLSPDGRRVAFRRVDALGASSLWLYDLERNTETRLTPSRLLVGAPMWLPDGRRVVFRGTDTGGDAMYMNAVDGGQEAVFLKAAHPLTPADWSRDNRWFLYTEINPKTGADIWLLPNPSVPAVDRKPIPLLRTSFGESLGQISPDGKWLAYFSNESGTEQVYLRPFSGLAPASDLKWQVSNSSVLSRDARWRADGRELFYLENRVIGGAKALMSVLIGTGPSPAGTPTPLFEFRGTFTTPQNNSFSYSPAPDGQRFLVNAFVTDAPPSLEVILNWGTTPDQ